MSEKTSEFERAMNHAADRAKSWEYEIDSTSDFKVGAKWARRWVSDKGIGGLTKWMKSTEARRTEKLEGVIRFCAGLISTMDQFKDKHPQEVEDWIYNEFKKTSQS